MDEKFRLVFRGELLDGQHRAVVKRRLAERLKLDDAQIEKLFSGDSVVVKRDADRETAARYQSVFKQAGGLLRVQAVGSETPGSHSAPEKAVPEKHRPAGVSLSGARLKAIRPAANPDVDAPDLSVLTTYFPPPKEAAPEIRAPDFVVAEVGALLKQHTNQLEAQVIDADFELAEVGADLLEQPRIVKVVDLGPLDFDLAEVGADLGPGPGAPAPPAPDVSHLALVEA
ncbi:MAG: hypothetical protein AB7I04_19230 [Pseudomonadales bacterium]